MDDIVVIIPVLNEEETIAGVVKSLQHRGLTRILVVDNGSCDRTSSIAAQAGAQVITEARRGYGQACWSGLQTETARQAEWILFCDGDGSDDLDALSELIAVRNDYDFVLGNRRGTAEGRSQLTPVQNFGNWLSTRLIRLGWGYAYEDLGPLRLIRQRSLDGLEMRDRGFGWTVEMQAKAVEQRLRIYEKPVKYNPRQGGQSKISGTLRGSFQAGTIILTTLGKLYCQKVQRTLGCPAQTRSQKTLNCSLTQRILRWISVGLLIAGSLVAAPYGDFFQPAAVPLFWRGIALMSLGFVCCWALKQLPGRWFWVGAIVPRLVLLTMHPGDDIWRYIWEGHIQLAGFNPYLLAPNAEVLAPLRFSGWAFINHPDHAAIYPPVTQLGFRALAAISAIVSSPILLFKLSFVAADLAICKLLSRQFGYSAALLYGWNPLVIYSFAGGGHYDSWFLLPLVVAWLSDSHNKLSSYKSAIAIGLSIAIKWMSLPVLAFIAWRASVAGDRKAMAPQMMTKRVLTGLSLVLLGMSPLLLSALPFCSGTGTALSCPVLPLESSFVNYGRSAAFIPHFVSLLWPNAAYENWVYAIPLGIVVLWNLARWQILFKEDSPSISLFTERYFIALLLLSPIIHAWYFTWLTPFAVANRSWSTRWVSLSAFVYFALPHGLALGKQQWALSSFQHSLLWVPFVFPLVWQSLGNTVRSKNL